VAGVGLFSKKNEEEERKEKKKEDRERTLTLTLCVCGLEDELSLIFHGDSLPILCTAPDLTLCIDLLLVLLKLSHLLLRHDVLLLLMEDVKQLLPKLTMC